MKFRTANLDDLTTLNAISLQSKAYWGYPAAWLDNWKEDLALDEAQFAKQHILVAEVDHKIIGFSSITEHQETYEILHLWIQPAYIGKGYGKKLLEAIIKRWVKVEKPIIVEADPNAEPFYEGQGFTTFDKVESFPKGRYLPVMIKKPKANRHSS